MFKTFQILLTSAEAGGNGNPAAETVAAGTPAEPKTAETPAKAPEPARAAPALSADERKKLQTRISELEDENRRLKAAGTIQRPQLPKPQHQPGFKKSWLDGCTMLDN